MNNRFKPDRLSGIVKSRLAGAWQTMGSKVIAGGVLVAVLAGCGGGGTDGTVGSGGTGSASSAATASDRLNTVAVGPITGFGSIIVNGVKYDDSQASVSSDDRGGITRSDLRLGMLVEVRGSSSASTGLGTANSVSVRSELKGVVQNRTATDFVLLGVIVRTDANTVYENTSNAVNGDFVEVYGVYDPSNRVLLATRVEKKTAAEQKLRGAVSALDVAARRFSIGTVLIDYSNAGQIAGLANGADVQVYGPTPPSTGAWSISRGVVQGSLSLSNVSRVELKAVIEQFTSLANFRLSGLSVDGSGAVFEGGSAAQLAVGVRVELKGDVQGTTVRATKIQIEGNSSGSGSNAGVTAGVEFEVKGRIESLVSPGRFVVRGALIDASGAVTFEGGTAAQLGNGVCVEVKGILGTTAGGSTVRASRIAFDNDC